MSCGVLRALRTGTDPVRHLNEVLKGFVRWPFYSQYSTSDLRQAGHFAKSCEVWYRTAGPASGITEPKLLSALFKIKSMPDSAGVRNKLSKVVNAPVKVNQHLARPRCPLEVLEGLLDSHNNPY